MILTARQLRFLYFYKIEDVGSSIVCPPKNSIAFWAIFVYGRPDAEPQVHYRLKKIPVFMQRYFPKIAVKILDRVTATAGIKADSTATHIIVSARAIKSVFVSTKTESQIGRTKGWRLK